MGGAQGKGLHLPTKHLLGSVNEKFKSEEIKVLERTFQDLASRSSGKDIDKLTFLKVFNLPGYLGDRLFAAFDRRHNGVIDLEEFVGGLGLIVRGDIDDKIDFLFTMYDLKGDGVVSRTELTTMLNSVVFAAYTIVEASSIDVEATVDLDEGWSKEVAHTLHSKVDELVDSAFAEKSTDDTLTKDEFRRWVMKHGEALDVVESLLGRPRTRARTASQNMHVDTLSKPDKVTFEDIVSSPASPGLKNLGDSALRHGVKTSPKTPAIKCSRCQYEMRCSYCNKCGKHVSQEFSCSSCGPILNSAMLTFCLSCGYDLRLNGKPLEPAYGRSSRSEKYGRQPCQMEGWLFKVGSILKNLKPRWFVLKDSFLYAFRHEQSVRPSGVIYLEGCFVDKVDDSRKSSKLKYGIEILISEKLSQRRFLYAKSEKIRDAWIVAIRERARQFLLEDYYEIGRELGIGKFSTVHAATHKATGKQFAVKIIDKSSMENEEREALRTEIAVLQLVNHPNVIHLKNVFESKSRIYIVTTLVQGGDLFNRLVNRSRFPEDTARVITVQLLEAIGYLHERGIVHRDLKPENIMMTYSDRDDHVQVGDFGLSKFSAPDEMMKLPCGTLAYVAPEVLQLKGYGKQVDLWSIGVILFVLLRGKLPFDSKKRSEVVSKTLQGDLPIENDPIWKTVSPLAIDIVRKLLEPDPKQRLTVAKALKHEWITGIEPQSSLSEFEDDSESGHAILRQHRNELGLNSSIVLDALEEEDGVNSIKDVACSDLDRSSTSAPDEEQQLSPRRSAELSQIPQEAQEETEVPCVKQQDEKQAGSDPVQGSADLMPTAPTTS